MMSRSMTLAGSAAPCSWKTTSSSRSTPPARTPTPCHAGRKRASVSGGPHSTSRRSAASERLRNMRSPPGWQCSGARRAVRIWRAARNPDPESLAVPARIFDRDPASLTRNAHRNRAPLALQRSQPIDCESARDRLLFVEVAQPDQQVVRLVRIARKTFRKEALQFQLHGGDGRRVEELSQVLAAEQLCQQLAVECQRLRAALGQRRVALVHELGHIREEE